jgi:hypothetical protein
LTTSTPTGFVVDAHPAKTSAGFAVALLVQREAGDPVLDLRPDEVAAHRRASTW